MHWSPVHFVSVSEVMDSRVGRGGRIVLSTTVAVGIGAAAIFMYTKYLNSVRREHEELMHLVERLVTEVETLRKEVVELKIGVQRPPPRVRPRARNFIELGAGDVGTLTKDDRYRRGGSLQSLTSDDYADAEEGWQICYAIRMELFWL
ncbi:hypothetical protein GCK32_003641 [Trichostrongylus colubriformis]|uniref:Uncharacterized protein n=1 Tax=Trichostrongylus colubriformis TaxID=6319 RepID=A0AAN8F5L7_TRICO